MSILEIETLITGQLSANCYLVYHPETLVATIIDPGDDAVYIQTYLQDLELTPDKIILTHGHFDHLMAATELQLNFNLPLFIHSADEFLVNRLQETALHFVNTDPGPPPKISAFLEKDTPINIAGIPFQVVYTPGHTPGSVSLYSKHEKAVFVGDVIFAGGAIGRYDFSYSIQSDLQNSIKTLLALPSQTTVYSGHGPVTSIASEQAHHLS